MKCSASAHEMSTRNVAEISEETAVMTSSRARPFTACAGRAALQPVLPRCNRSCRVATGRAALQPVLPRCNRSCRVATGRAALQQVVPRCNRSCRVATGRAALQQIVPRCNRSCRVATGCINDELARSPDPS